MPIQSPNLLSPKISKYQLDTFDYPPSHFAPINPNTGSNRCLAKNDGQLNAHPVNQIQKGVPDNICHNLHLIARPGKQDPLLRTLSSVRVMQPIRSIEAAPRVIMSYQKLSIFRAKKRFSRVKLSGSRRKWRLHLGLLLWVKWHNRNVFFIIYFSGTFNPLVPVILFYYCY